MSGEELNYVHDAFDTNWIAPLGPHVDAFERELAAYCGTKGAVALGSGTAAIHLALIVMGVSQGDSVICQTFTFSATANPIKYLGANPIFVDSEPDTWNMSPEALEEAIRESPEKPKAIIPVHLYGMPANMNEILAIAGKYDIPVLEDAAEALGSSLNGVPCGSFGDFGVLSFNGNKIITTSGGGALLSDNLEALEQVRFLATQARDKAPHYQHSRVGYNYRLSNILAGIGRAQLGVLSNRVMARRANFEFYKRKLGSIPGIRFVEEQPGYFSNRWLTTILVDSSLTGGVTREDIRLALEKDHIESRPLWKPMHLQPVFAGDRYYGGMVSERLFDQGLCLPSGSNLTTEEKVRILKSIMGRL